MPVHISMKPITASQVQSWFRQSFKRREVPGEEVCEKMARQLGLMVNGTAYSPRDQNKRLRDSWNVVVKAIPKRITYWNEFNAYRAKYGLAVNAGLIDELEHLARILGDTEKLILTPSLRTGTKWHAHARIIQARVVDAFQESTMEALSVNYDSPIILFIKLALSAIGDGNRELTAIASVLQRAGGVRRVYRKRGRRDLRSSEGG